MIARDRHMMFIMYVSDNFVPLRKTNVKGKKLMLKDEK